MNIETFFEELHEKNWRDNISAEVSRNIDNLIESLSINKKDITEDIVKRIKNMESLKSATPSSIGTMSSLSFICLETTFSEGAKIVLRFIFRFIT